jgi:hypothetical protein
MSQCALMSLCCINGGRIIIFFIAYTYEQEVLIAIQFLETRILRNILYSSFLDPFMKQVVMYSLAVYFHCIGDEIQACKKNLQWS